MKKLLLVLASLILAGGVFAEKKSGQIELGVYGSYDLINSTQSKYVAFSTEKGENDGGSGGSFGFSANYFINSSNAIVFGAGYQSYNPSLKISDGIDWIKYDASVVFIDLKLGYRYYAGGFFGGAGFDFGFVSKYEIHETDSTGSDITYKVGDSVNNPTGSKSNNFDLYLELGYSFQINDQVSLDFSGKYRIGLTNIYTDSKISVKFDEVKMRVLGLQAGINFAF